MKINKLFEDVFMDIDWSLYDDETADLSGLEKKIYRDMVCTHHPKTREELVEAIKTELENGNTDLNCIDTSAITDMSSLFSDIENEICVGNIDISRWDTSNVTDMSAMFADCHSFNANLSNWVVSRVKYMAEMFYNCYEFDSELNAWDVSSVEDMSYMLCGCGGFFDDLSSWNLSKSRPPLMTSMFSGCYGLESLGCIPYWYDGE